FFVNGRLGIAAWDLKAESTDSYYPDKVEKGSEDGNDLYYGFGFKYLASDNIYLGLEYTVTNMSSDKTEKDGEFTGKVNIDYDVSNFAIFVGVNF
ncbi:outer membrane beta-barrel protein, partial [Pseudoalteromonas phenolica]